MAPFAGIVPVPAHRCRMTWWSKKSDPPVEPPGTNVIPFRRADRPDMINHLRQNAERRMRPVAPPREIEDSRASFVPSDFRSVDELLWKARQDIRHGLINPTACLIVMYDQDRGKVIWYQFGRENDEADEAFTDWLREVVLDE